MESVPNLFGQLRTPLLLVKVSGKDIDSYERESRLDIVFIENLKVPATIGVWEWEHRIKQNLIFDIELGCDFQKAAESDEVENTVSYKDVAVRVSEFISESRFKLLETVADKTAGLILDEFPVSWCKVKVSKPRAVEMAKNVGVIVERGARTE